MCKGSGLRCGDDGPHIKGCEQEVSYIINGNKHTKCPKANDGKHKWESHSITGIPQCSECGILVDKTS
jgi:hypothetical protein